MGYGGIDIRLEDVISAVGRAEDQLARLDERVARSALREGFIERGHFFDAAASMWINGELVHVEDLVLHDASMDIRAPTHELILAHAILRARRRMWREAAAWGVSANALAALRGRAAADASDQVAEVDSDDDEDVDDGSVGAFAEEFAELDAAIAAADRLLAGGSAGRAGEPATPTSRPGADFLIYDPDWDEESRLSAWHALASDVDALPPVLAGAILWEAWERIEPLQTQHWLGNLLVAAYLRVRGKVTSHLFGVSAGLKTIPRERRRARTRTERIAACLDGMIAAADADLEKLNRLHLAKGQIEYRLRGRRSSSSLPAVVELLFARPIVTAGMIAKAAKITPRGALNLVGELGVREMTGRRRYRAWGVL